MPTNPVAEEAVRNVVLGVIDPELGDNIVDLGMVQVIEIDPQSGDVDLTIALTTAGCPLRAQITKDIKLRVASLPGVAEVRVHPGEMFAPRGTELREVLRAGASDWRLDEVVSGLWMNRADRYSRPGRYGPLVCTRSR